MFNFLVTIIDKFGLWGIFLLMLADNLIPIIPSELILPLVGYQTAQGEFSLQAAILAGTAGSALGGMFWYGIGQLIGLERLQRIVHRHGRWLPITSKEIDQAHAWFRRWGGPAVCASRMLPGVPAAVCMPAGIARIPLLQFVFWSTIGAAAWVTLLVSAGIVLNAHYALVHRWLNPVADVVLLFSSVACLYRIISYRFKDVPVDEQ